MKQIQVEDTPFGYIVKLPADKNGYLHPIYQTNRVFIGQMMNENWGYPDANLEYRIKEIDDMTYELLYDDIYIAMKEVNRNFYANLYAFIKERLNEGRSKSTTMLEILEMSDDLESARANFRKAQLGHYVVVLDAYAYEFEKEVGL